MYRKSSLSPTFGLPLASNLPGTRPWIRTRLRIDKESKEIRVPRSLRCRAFGPRGFQELVNLLLLHLGFHPPPDQRLQDSRPSRINSRLSDGWVLESWAMVTIASLVGGCHVTVVQGFRVNSSETLGRFPLSQ